MGRKCCIKNCASGRQGERRRLKKSGLQQTSIFNVPRVSKTEKIFCCVKTLMVTFTRIHEVKICVTVVSAIKFDE